MENLNRSRTHKETELGIKHLLIKKRLVPGGITSKFY